MVVEEPLLRLGVILAMAAGAAVLLLLTALIMYACCRGHRGRATDSAMVGLGPAPGISAIFHPARVFPHDDTEVNLNPMQLQQQPVYERRYNSRETTRASKPRETIRNSQPREATRNSQPSEAIRNSQPKEAMGSSQPKKTNRRPTTDSRESERDTTPPPAYEDIVFPAQPDKLAETHDYCT